MQVPTVTLEDLQAFQASHFPGHPQTIHPPAAEPADDDTYEDGEEDLGYYPDGVKRTLTDEQIRIFRHSEIHALLRERQLQQDEADYEARREKSEDEPHQTVGVKENAMNAVAESPSVQGSATIAQPSSRQQPKGLSRPVPTAAESEYLDYGETDETSTDKGLTQEPQIIHPRRKVISYDD
ncbi:hypothetical protein N7481_000323 [Penicillium waksmanii]|uniref:uncharacterized protein n=1 Tax=Penicillium waksmanii TaxID=69791 RepID=UPI00254720C3|nr:uncharacterized protein N7481_000323 [Penicillium waksmanii]KAJ5999914.1 hypothetical protein N7481_000323 [Penicillium waksmanii]